MAAMIRPEQPTDVNPIRRVLEAAFPSSDEARLVDLLRESGNLRVSLVAEVDGEVVGHVGFSTVRVDGRDDAERGIGLAPLAVLPQRQRQGIGDRLVREGLAACERAGFGWLVVLGHPTFYARFGFARASCRGL